MEPAGATGLLHAPHRGEHRVVEKHGQTQMLKREKAMHDAGQILSKPYTYTLRSAFAYTASEVVLHAHPASLGSCSEVVVFLFYLMCCHGQGSLAFMMSATPQPMSRTANYYISASPVLETTKESVRPSNHERCIYDASRAPFQYLWQRDRDEAGVGGTGWG